MKMSISVDGNIGMGFLPCLAGWGVGEGGAKTPPSVIHLEISISLGCVHHREKVARRVSRLSSCRKRNSDGRF